MTDRLIFFLQDRSGRERLLLAVLCLVVLPLGLWTALLQPMQDRRLAARSDLAEALILQQWVNDRAHESQRLILAGSGADTPPIGIAGLEQSLIEAGLREDISELTRRGDRDIELRFDAVGFVDLGDWLSRVSLSWGYEISSFRIERGDKAGVVAASFSLGAQN